MQKRDRHRKKPYPPNKRPPEKRPVPIEEPCSREIRIAAGGNKKDICSMLPLEIEAVLVEMGQQKFRAGQIFAWLSQGVSSFEEMTNLSKDFRKQLAENFILTAPVLLEKQSSQIDDTVKFLWELSDGNTIESVWMEHSHGATICVSTQVGCRMGCSFCATAIGGFTRNLTAGEMLAQVIWANKTQGKAVSNIVLMGMGEPLDNLDEVLGFLNLINHPKGQNIGMRHVTLSTAGMIEKIDKLSTYQLQLNLAVSLHAIDDEIREKLMPINRKAGVRALLETCKAYQDKTGRRVSYEYALIAGVNDSPLQAKQLAKAILEVHGHVNIIPLNPVAGRNFTGSNEQAVLKFTNMLQSQGVNVTVRKRKGDDIDAACGQLRQKRR